MNDLIKNLIEYDKAYFDGNPLITDVQYDQLWKEAKELFPDHDYFKTVGSTERGGKLDLPYNMGSLDQVYDEKDLTNWVARNNLSNSTFVLSHKLDGVSCMLHYNHGKLQQAFSRGDGVQGADITRHLIKMDSVPKHIGFTDNLYVRGEVIMSNPKFEANYTNDFKNPRNMVAGCMNRKVTDEAILNNIDFIAYDIVDIVNFDGQLTKTNSLTELTKWGFLVVKYEVSSQLNMTNLTQTLSSFRSASEYELDGLVITSENYLDVGDRKSQSLNPTHSTKFKVLDKNSIVGTKVVKVHWEISKHGFLKPRVEVSPVELFGTTVRYATGFNARFIDDNQIGKGTLINITKSGSVIPYILDVVKSTGAEFPDEEWAWNDNKVEIVVDENNPTVLFKQALDFFVSLDVDLLKEATLEKMYEAFDLWGKPFTDVCEELFDLLSMEWENVIGVNGEKVYDSLHRRLNNMTWETFLGSLPFMGFGFGIRKARQLISQIDISNLWNLSKDDIIALDGFDEITAEKLINSLPKAKSFLHKFEQYIEIIEKNVSSELNGVVVVMTGFRDKALKTQIEDAGGRVTSAVSKKTTHLLANDVNSNSGKVKKARDLEIEITTPSLFRDEFNL